MGEAMRSSPRRRLLLLGSTAALLLTAQPCFAQAEPSDPWEKMNRRFFAVQDVLDRRIFGPLARSYGQAPSPLRSGLRNFARNLGEPLVAVNDVLQGRVGTAASTVGRFVINSTVGIAGLNDPAKDGGIPHHDNGFGTTLGRWGARPGPYLFLPLIGPSSVRDGFGSAADIGLNPLTYMQYTGKTYVGATTTVVGGLDTRFGAQQDLDTIRQTSTDPYATLRSYYLQNRQAEITGQTEIGPLPEFDETPAPEAVSPTGKPIAQPQPAAPTPPLSGEAGALPRPAPPPEPAPPLEPPPPPGPPSGSACQVPP
jgi:phospholipid-binding lipoprotein MlaA